MFHTHKKNSLIKLTNADSSVTIRNCTLIFKMVLTFLYILGAWITIQMVPGTFFIVTYLFLILTLTLTHYVRITI